MWVPGSAPFLAAICWRRVTRILAHLYPNSAVLAAGLWPPQQNLAQPALPKQQLRHQGEPPRSHRRQSPSHPKPRAANDSSGDDFQVVGNPPHHRRTTGAPPNHPSQISRSVPGKHQPERRGGGMASAEHRKHTWEHGRPMARSSRSEDDSPADTAATHVLRDCLLTSGAF